MILSAKRREQKLRNVLLLLRTTIRALLKKFNILFWVLIGHFEVARDTESLLCRITLQATEKRVMAKLDAPKSPKSGWTPRDNYTT